MAITRRALFGAVAAMVCVGAPSVARSGGGLDDPDRPILAVKRGGVTLARFSRADLAAMPQTKIVTHTPWASEATTYEGPTVAAFLAGLGETGERFHLAALNDYLVTAERSLLTEAGAILAIRENGRFMAVANKGPVFVMFPFDADRRLQSQQYYSRAVWQLVEIDMS
ncbi:hypothetical protein [Jiella sonneratiae]|uniref:Oxidoreductase molybdopterin-binding domain-containing protein n=1 Tax=Jiella sonneratiae TaxID=2816856 RepID=A0ABS3J0H2_9HYPH|nr:hypothetical protein [Jiella sonneratiae]MBO0903156.1 hypothetical protein [Jiella sonneratiae]